MTNTPPAQTTISDPAVISAIVQAKAVVENAKISARAAVVSAVIAAGAGLVGVIYTMIQSNDAGKSATQAKLAGALANVPPGTVIAWAGAWTDENRKALEELGWFACEGERKLDTTHYPEYARWVNRAWTAPDDRTGALHIPDLRGQFLRGVSGDRQVGDFQTASVGTHRHYLAQNKFAEKVEADALHEIVYVGVSGAAPASPAYTLIRGVGATPGTPSHPGYVGLSSPPVVNDENPRLAEGETRPDNAGIIWLIYVGKRQTPST